MVALAVRFDAAEPMILAYLRTSTSRPSSAIWQRQAAACRRAW